MLYKEIEIDFDVFKLLTVMRLSENMTYNDVLRKLLELDPKDDSDDKTANKENTPDSKT